MSCPNNLFKSFIHSTTEKACDGMLISSSKTSTFRKKDLLYLEGEMGFQGVFSKAPSFDGRTTEKISARSMNVVEALIFRRKRETNTNESALLKTVLQPGISGSFMLGLLTWDSLDNCKGLPFSREGIEFAAEDLCLQTPVWRTYDVQGIIRSLHSLMVATSRALAIALHSPSSEYFNVANNLLGWSWLCEIIPDNIKFAKNVEATLRHGDTYWKKWEPDAPFFEPITVNLGDGHLKVLSDALFTILKWRLDRDYFAKLSSSEKLAARSLIGNQLFEVSSTSSPMVASSPNDQDPGGLLATATGRPRVSARHFQLA